MQSTPSLWQILTSRIFVIAEIANVHEGDFDYAKELVRRVPDTGADAVKFQVYLPEEVCAPSNPDYAEFTRLAFGQEQWRELIRLAQDEGIRVFADIYGEAGLEWAERLGIQGYKIHSSDVVNHPLIKKVVACHKPMLLSVGGSTLMEVFDALQVALAAGNDQIVLMHGFQAFPTQLHHSQLGRIAALRRHWPFPAGFANHGDGDSPWSITLPLLAVAAGAQVLEEHITLDRSRRKDDDHSALNPDEFSQLVDRVRCLPDIMGREEWDLSEPERAYRRRFKKNLVAVKDIPQGAALSEDGLSYVRAQSEAHPARLEEVVGKAASVNIRAGEVITFDKLRLRTVVLVAVRNCSERLPNKALLELCGQSTLGHLLDRVKRATLPDAVVVATSPHPDDDVLVSIAEEKGVKWFRGSENDVLQRFIDAAEREQADVVVRVTADNVLTDPVYIDKTVQYHLSHNLDFTSSVDGLPDRVGCEVVSVAVLKAAHRWGRGTDHSEYMTWFLDRPDLFRTGKVPCDPGHFRPNYRLTLDFLEDLELLRKIFSELYVPEQVFSTDVLIQFLDEHPEVLKMMEAAKAMDRNVPMTRDKLGIKVNWPPISALPDFSESLES